MVKECSPVTEMTSLGPTLMQTIRNSLHEIIQVKDFVHYMAHCTVKKCLLLLANRIMINKPTLSFRSGTCPIYLCIPLTFQPNAWKTGNFQSYTYNLSGCVNTLLTYWNNFSTILVVLFYQSRKKKYLNDSCLASWWRDGCLKVISY